MRFDEESPKACTIEMYLQNEFHNMKNNLLNNVYPRSAIYKTIKMASENRFRSKSMPRRLATLEILHVRNMSGKITRINSKFLAINIFRI